MEIKNFVNIENKTDHFPEHVHPGVLILEHECPDKYFRVDQLFAELITQEQRKESLKNLGINTLVKQLTESDNQILVSLGEEIERASKEEQRLQLEINKTNNQGNKTEEELIKVIRGISSDSDSSQDPFKQLGRFFSLEKFNSKLNSLIFDNTVLGNNCGYFRANVNLKEFEIKNIVTPDHSIIQVISGLFVVKNGLLVGNNKIYTIATRRYSEETWSDWITVINSESLISLQDTINTEKQRVDVIQNKVLDGITLRFDEIDDTDVYISSEPTISIAKIVYCKKLKTFAAVDDFGHYSYNFDGSDYYIHNNKVRKDKIYICGSSLYVCVNDDLVDVTADLKRLFIDLIGTAPETLDSIHEIAAWILNDESGATAMATLISQNKSDIAGEVSRATEAEQQLNDSLQTLATEKADKDGYYSKLTTGFSDNLVGRGEAVEAQFTFRPTGGTQSVEDGVARIESVKGNTIVWNLLAKIKDSVTENGLTIESVGDGSYKLYTATDVPITANVFYPITDVLIRGRKVIFYGGTSTCTLKASSGIQDVGAGAIITSAATDEVVGIFVAAGTIINTAVTIFPQVFDVTKMFKVAADRPITVDEFRIMFPKHNYPYNTGELLSLSASGVKSVGFNQFNKETAKKGYAISYGAEVPAYDYLCSDYIKVVPNQTYYISYVSNIAYLSSVAMYDASYRYLKTTYVGTNGANTGTKYALGKLTITDNRVAYIRVNIPQGYLDKCCVNFSHTGYRDGEYEAYEETIRQLPIKKYFPDGMKSARGVYDELTTTQAIKRVSVVADLSKLAWQINTTSVGTKRFLCTEVVQGAKSISESTIGNLVCAALPAISATNTFYGENNGIAYFERHLYLYNKEWEEYTVQQLKEVLSGVSLYYELATPVVIDLPEPLNFDYTVSDFGTEELVTDEFSSPVKMSVVYGFNAVDTIRGNKLAIESLKEDIPSLDNKIESEAQRAETVEQQLQQSIITEQQRAESAEAELDARKADDTGYYPEMSVGFSNNLVGRGEAVEALFNCRPSGGKLSIEDGVAHIERIKGNSIVWNQYCYNGTDDWKRWSANTSSVKATKNADGSLSLIGLGESSSGGNYDPRFDFKLEKSFVRSNHKYLFCIKHRLSNDTGEDTAPSRISIYGTKNSTQSVDSSYSSTYTIFSWIGYLDPDSSYCGLFRAYNKKTTAELIVRDAIIVDLTLIFGAGNEPATIEEFNSLIPEFSYSYNPGELQSFMAGGIKAIGFNMFDKSTVEYGVMHSSAVSNKQSDHQNQYYVSDYIRIVPGKAYYFKDIVGKAYWAAVNGYDADKNYVATYMPEIVVTSRKNDSFLVDFSSRPNISYVRICLPATHIDSCCVNLSHSGYRDGQYEPYQEITRLLPIKEYFPSGMKSVGSVYDELTATQAIKRVGVVEDLGKLNWWEGPTQSGRVRYSASIGTDSKGAISDNVANITCPILNTSAAVNTYYGYSDTGIISLTENHVYVYNPNWQTMQAVKSALAGVNLIYELKTPVVTELSEPLNLDYNISDFGIEMLVFNENNAPLKADIIYNFNAVDSIRNNYTQINENTAAIIAEKERAENAETQLLNTITTTITAVETQLQSKIDADVASETARAQAAENELNARKADEDGYHPKLTSGFADNLVGRGETTEAQFSYRPSGGTQSILDGVARIERIKGNTIVWNQLSKVLESTTINGLTIESVGDGSYKLYTATDTPTTADAFFPVTDKLIGGHKVVFYGGTSTCTLKASSGVQDIGAGAIIASATADEVVGIFVAAGTTINTAVTMFPQVFDVTKMFGTGAAITTVGELRELFPKADNAYNTGELISFNAEAIVTVGFNQFDKSKAVYGVINAGTVSNKQSDHLNLYYVSDYIRIIPGRKYYFKNIVNRAHWTAVQGLDANKQYVKSFLPAQATVSKQEDSFIADFSDSPNICYIRICLPAAFLDSCCVSLVHTGYRNGDYEPYEETIRQLPIKEYFPDGMKGIMRFDKVWLYDELTVTQAIQRVGVIKDISKLDWWLVNNTFVSQQISNAPTETNFLVSTLDYSNSYYRDNCYTITDNRRLYILDSTCTNIADLKAKIAGVSVYYQLATPVVTELPEPLNLNYTISDFGTEEAVSKENSAPFRADIVYDFNAVDTIRNNRIMIAELLARIEALEGK